MTPKNRLLRCPRRRAAVAVLNRQQALAMLDDIAAMVAVEGTPETRVALAEAIRRCSRAITLMSAIIDLPHVPTVPTNDPFY